MKSGSPTFTACKGARATITIAGRSMEAQKIRISMAGIPSALWHGNYFHSLDTDAYVRYEGTNGPPGTPPTRIDLVTAR